MAVTKDLPLAGLNIRFPFEGSEDVGFSGAYGGLAESLRQLLLNRGEGDNYSKKLLKKRGALTPLQRIFLGS